MHPSPKLSLVPSLHNNPLKLEDFKAVPEAFIAYFLASISAGAITHIDARIICAILALHRGGPFEAIQSFQIKRKISYEITYPEIESTRLKFSALIAEYNEFPPIKKFKTPILRKALEWLAIYGDTTSVGIVFHFATRQIRHKEYWGRMKVTDLAQLLQKKERTIRKSISKLISAGILKSEHEKNTIMLKKFGRKFRFIQP